MKSLVTATLITSAMFASFAQADDSKAIQLYGKANLAVVVADEGVDTYSDIKSHASRFGAKGEFKLDNGLTALYVYEWQVNPDDKKDNLTARNQYLGVKGNFGEVVIGRIDTAFKKSQGKVDLFSDYKADIKNLWEGENRLADVINFKSASFNGFKVAATYVTEASDDPEAKPGVSLAVSYGDEKLKKSDTYFAIANDSEVDGVDATRFVASIKLDQLKLGAIYQTEEKVDGTDELDGIFVSAAYKLGSATLKAQYQTADQDMGANKTSTTLGVDYKLGAATKAYTWYSRIDNDIDGSDEGYFALGLEQKF
ncbi:porin [Saccharobesus litoralis]|uniref:Porin n=1 Tax=Saccharobesus litoralis TaxID=2172099 RepID=A0A2S0VMS2_9ALTE|nr:porin [Saccharobesus litoralis]AWB65518.1 porin [Saccharobesus litoralis]